MSLTSKITAGVNKAFIAAGDLVKTATLSNKVATNFDFLTNTATTATTPRSVETILTSSKKGGNISTSVVMKSGIDISVYDTITIDTVSYNFVGDHSDNGFVIEATIIKEN